MNLNKVFIAGRLTADPQLRTTPTGRQVASFSVATNRVWTTQAGQKQEAVEYHNIVVWDRQADIASRFLAKGGLVLVEGRLQTRGWEDKQGQKRRTTEVVAERIQLGPRSGGAGPMKSQASEGSGQSFSEVPTVNIEETDSVSVESPAAEIKPEDLPF